MFLTLVIFLLLLDLWAHRKPKKESLKRTALWSGFWILLALVFNLYIYFSRGKVDALNFFTGYIIEKSLSVDNLFVFLMIFNYFKTPATSLRKVLFYGVVGAMVLRAIFIVAGIALIQNFHYVIYVFGIFLIYTGIKFLLQKEKKVNYEKNILIVWIKKIIPFTHTYVKDKFFVRKKFTLLFLVLIVVEITDLIFALDSIPAIFAITYDPYIVYTSNIFALLGLRSLFFVLLHVWGMFHYLRYALSFILVFTGVKMVLSDFYKISTLTSLSLIFLSLLAAILASRFFPTKKRFTKFPE